MIHHSEDYFFSTFLDTIRMSDRILLFCHTAPDGDTLGSALALQLALQKIHIEADIVCADAVPPMYTFMKNAEKILRHHEVESTSYQLYIALDASEPYRLGILEGIFSQGSPTCLIDHHLAGFPFAALNVVNSQACATGILVYKLIRELNIQMDADIAAHLFIAISTDTGNFSLDNTNAEAFAVATELMAYPFNLASICRLLYKQYSSEQLKLQACAFKSLKIYQNGIAGMTLRLKDFEKTAARPDQTEAIIGYGIGLIGINAAFLAMETTDKRIKFSFRGKPPVDVAEVAVNLGGGGHKLAAGCIIDGPMAHAVNQVIALLSKQVTLCNYERVH